MGKVLAGTYRYVRETGDENRPYERVVLRTGDDLPKDFDKDEAKQLEEDGLLVEEDRLTEDGVRIPEGVRGRTLKVTQHSGLAAGGAEPQGGGDSGTKTAKTTGTKSSDKS